MANELNSSTDVADSNTVLSHSSSLSGTVLTQYFPSSSSSLPAQPGMPGDLASRTPYRRPDFCYYRQLVHYAYGQLPSFKEIDANIFLKLCTRTNASVVPRETRQLWHQIFNDEVACEFCATVQACTFCFECNKILCPDCTHAVSCKGARCFDCLQTLINESNYRPKPSISPELATVILRPKRKLPPPRGTSTSSRSIVNMDDTEH